MTAQAAAQYAVTMPKLKGTREIASTLHPPITRTRVAPHCSPCTSSQLSWASSFQALAERPALEPPRFLLGGQRRPAPPIWYSGEHFWAGLGAAALWGSSPAASTNFHDKITARHKALCSKRHSPGRDFRGRCFGRGLSARHVAAAVGGRVTSVCTSCAAMALTGTAKLSWKLAGGAR
jgi:hypothetical protein